MRFYIPSYKRPNNVLTIAYLESVGVRHEDIFVATQTQEDFDAYTKTLKGRANVIFRPAHNVAGNRNTCILHARENGIGEFIMMDDDIKSLMSFVPTRNTHINTRELFGEFLAYMSNVKQRTNAQIIGMYPIGNDMFANSQPVISKSILAGFFLYFTNVSNLFDETFAIKEDFELCLRIFASGKNVVRMNRFWAKIALHQQGGCHDDFAAGKSKQATERLLLVYPDLVQRGRKDELKMKRI